MHYKKIFLKDCNIEQTFFIQFLVVLSLLFLSPLHYCSPPLLPRIFWVYSISNVLLHYYQGPTPYKWEQTKRKKPYPWPSSLLAEALSIWTAATFQNDIFSAVIIIVIRKWLIRWRPETNFKGTRGPEQGHAAVQCILSPALRKLPWQNSLTKPGHRS